MNGLDPDVEILRADLLFERIGYLRPEIFHKIDLEGKEDGS
jgi:hypothetical protein